MYYSDSAYWLVGRIIVEYYLRGNPSQIHKRLFNSYREFSNWISNSVTSNEVRMLTTKHEIIYPNEMQGACCICKR